MYKSKHENHIEYPSKVNNKYKIHLTTDKNGTITWKVEYLKHDDTSIWLRSISTTPYNVDSYLKIKSMRTGHISTINGIAFIINTTDNNIVAYGYNQYVRYVSNERRNFRKYFRQEKTNDEISANFYLNNGDSISNIDIAVAEILILKK